MADLHINNLYTYKKYCKILKNKRIALVGPSWHTKGMGYGKLIESCDLIVRMNLGYIIPKKLQPDLGVRTDLLFSSLSKYYFTNKHFDKKKLMKMKKYLKCFCLTHHCIHKEGSRRLDIINQSVNIPIHIIERSDYKHIHNITKKKVTTGMITIYDLLKYSIKKLYIIGMSFYDIKVVGKKKDIFFWI